MIHDCDYDDLDWYDDDYERDLSGAIDNARPSEAVGTSECPGTCLPQCHWCLMSHDCPEQCGGGDECPYNADGPDAEPPDTVMGLHGKAMEAADCEDWDTAFGWEMRALRLFGSVDPSAEPTRSILTRSAAALALHAGRYREAAELVEAGLAGNPPSPIDRELLDIRAAIPDGGLP